MGAQQTEFSYADASTFDLSKIGDTFPFTWTALPNMIHVQIPTKPPFRNRLYGIAADISADHSLPVGTYGSGNILVVDGKFRFVLEQGRNLDVPTDDLPLLLNAVQDVNPYDTDYEFVPEPKLEVSGYGSMHVLLMMLAHPDAVDSNYDERLMIDGEQVYLASRNMSVVHAIAKDIGQIEPFKDVKEAASWIGQVIQRYNNWDAIINILHEWKGHTKEEWFRILRIALWHKEHMNKACLKAILNQWDEKTDLSTFAGIVAGFVQARKKKFDAQIVRDIATRYLTGEQIDAAALVANYILAIGQLKIDTHGLLIGEADIRLESFHDEYVNRFYWVLEQTHGTLPSEAGIQIATEMQDEDISDADILKVIQLAIDAHALKTGKVAAITFELPKNRIDTDIMESILAENMLRGQVRQLVKFYRDRNTFVRKCIMRMNDNKDTVSLVVEVLNKALKDKTLEDEATIHLVEVMNKHFPPHVFHYYSYMDGWMTSVKELLDSLLDANLDYIVVPMIASGLQPRSMILCAFELAYGPEVMEQMKYGITPANYRVWAGMVAVGIKLLRTGVSLDMDNMQIVKILGTALSKTQVATGLSRIVKIAELLHIGTDVAKNVSSLKKAMSELKEA